MSAPTLAVADDGPAVEMDIAGDLVRRALPVAPVLIGLCAAIWGWACLLYPSHASYDLLLLVLGGARILYKQNIITH